MSDYILTSNGELYHYGVLGMKWGVRRGNTAKAYEKASKKLAKLDAKVEKQRVKAEKKAIRADAATRRNRDKRVEQAKTSAANYRRRMDKANKWYKAMEKTFKNTDISLTKSQQELGKRYAESLRARLMFY